MTTIVDFPTAKLLKEKGFDEKCKLLYKDGELINCKPYNVVDNKTFQSTRYYIAPTIAEVVMWLYEKHGIWISVSHKRHSQNKHFAYNIKQANEIETYLWEFNSPTEAYQEAIKYCLTELS